MEDLKFTKINCLQEGKPPKHKKLQFEPLLLLWVSLICNYTYIICPIELHRVKINQKGFCLVDFDPMGQLNWVNEQLCHMM